MYRKDIVLITLHAVRGKKNKRQTEKIFYSVIFSLEKPFDRNILSEFSSVVRKYLSLSSSFRSGADRIASEVICK